MVVLTSTDLFRASFYSYRRQHANSTIIIFHEANRLTGITVKATNIRPPIKNVQDLGRDDFLICGNHTAVTKPAELVTITCEPDADGRYVYVYLLDTNYLAMCEVEIYGLGKTNFIMFNSRPRFK